MDILLIVALIVVFFGSIVIIGAPYVPTHQKELSKAFDTLYSVGKNDLVVDIGSGDGRVLRAASARGAHAVGYELNPLLWLMSRWLSVHDARVRVELRDAWTARFPEETTVVYAFAVQRDGKKLVRAVQREATRLGRPLVLMCYGSPLKQLKASATAGAHARYQIEPLQA